MLQFTIDDARCIRCGQCVADCPARIIELTEGALPSISAESEASCIKCQHCLAVCPTAAVSILGRHPDDSLALNADSFPTKEQMSDFIRGRRSVRQYQDANVDPALLRELLTTVANCPTGVNRRELTFNVIDDKAVMARFQQQAMAAVKEAAEVGRIPAQSAYLQAAATWKYEYAVKLFFRTAPHALIISAPPNAPCPEQDIALALAYFELLAQSAGLGTVWWGMLKSLLETVPSLKSLLGLPSDHHYYAMLFGIPAVRYPRAVQRDDAAKIERVTL